MMDNRYLPYGEKSEAFIQQRLGQLSAHLIERGAELIVIACNTATTQAVSTLRAQFHIPFVGTVPAIKPAATLAMGLGFSVLATPATCAGVYLQGLIDEFAGGQPVTCYGSSELVRLAEQKVWYQTNVNREVALELAKLGLLGVQPSLLVLGCTHFPFLKAELLEALPSSELLDTAQAIAKRVRTLVSTHSELATAQDTFISTAPLDETQRQRLPALGFGKAECFETACLLPY